MTPPTFQPPSGVAPPRAATRHSGVPRAVFLALLAVASSVLAGCVGSEGETGQRAPDFTVADTEGVNYTLSEWEGKPVFLFFMASWCSSCLHYSRGTMQGIYDAVAAAEGLVLSLSIYDLDTNGKLEKFANETDSRWPYALDREQAWRDYGVYAQSWGVAIGADQTVVVSKIDPSKDEVLAALGL